MPNKFDRFAEQAAHKADEEFRNEMAGLTRLNDAEIEAIIEATGISKKDLAGVLREVKDATASNEAKAKAISNINNGVSALVAIAKRLL